MRINRCVYWQRECVLSTLWNKIYIGVRLMRLDPRIQKLSQDIAAKETELRQLQSKPHSPALETMVKNQLEQLKAELRKISGPSF